MMESPRVVSAATGTSGSISVGAGQNIAIAPAVSYQTAGYLFTINPAQLTYSQTVDGETYSGFSACAAILRRIYERVARVVEGYANDGFGKLLALNDYLDVTNSGAYYIGTGGDGIFGKYGFSYTQTLDKENPIFFAPGYDDDETNTFFANTLCFVKGFESVPYLFNVNFQPKARTVRLYQSTAVPCILQVYLDWNCEYHVAGGV